MRLCQPKVVHIDMTPHTTTLHTQPPTLKLFNPSSSSGLSRKNTRYLNHNTHYLNRNNHHFSTKDNTKYTTTGHQFFANKILSERINRKNSALSQRMSCSAIFDKPIKSQPSMNHSCYNFDKQNKTISSQLTNSDNHKGAIYQQIQKYNQKLLSKVFMFEQDNKEKGYPHFANQTFQKYQARVEEGRRGRESREGLGHWVKAKRMGGKGSVTYKRVSQAERKQRDKSVFNPWDAIADSEEVNI